MALLLEIVSATQAESRFEGIGVAPAACEQLAIIYHHRKDAAAEITILERFAHQKHSPGASPPKLTDRVARRKKSTRG